MAKILKLDITEELSELKINRVYDDEEDNYLTEHFELNGEEISVLGFEITINLEIHSRTLITRNGEHLDTVNSLYDSDYSVIKDQDENDLEVVFDEAKVLEYIKYRR